jgi:WD40 repeat protein
VTIEWDQGGGPAPTSAPASVSASAPGAGAGPGPAGRGSRDQFRVNLWDTEHFERPLATLALWDATAPGPPAVPLAALSPDGKTLALARPRTPSVALYATDDGHDLGPIETQPELTALALGPDGLLATAGGGSIGLWDLDTRTPQPSFSPQSSFVRLLRFSPRGTVLAVAGLGAIELWDPTAHAVVSALPTSDWVDDLAFAPDGRTLAAAGQGSTTPAWAIVDPVVRRRISGFESEPTALAFREDGLLAMGARDGAIRFWRPGRCPSTAPGTGAIAAPGAAVRIVGDKPTSLAFDAQGRLVTFDPDTLRCWSCPPKCPSVTRVPLPDLPGRRMLFPAPLARVRDGQTLMVARPSQILVWQAREPGRVHILTPPAPPDSTVPESGRGPRGPRWRTIAASPAGDRLYLIDQAEAHAWALDGDRARRLNWSLPAGATCLALSPDGTILALGDKSGSITLVDTAHGAVRNRLDPSPSTSESPILSLAFAPNGQELAAGTQQGTIDLWSLNDTSRPLVRLPGHRGLVITLAYDAKGRHLASAGADKLVDIWDLDRLRTELNKLALEW